MTIHSLPSADLSTANPAPRKETAPCGLLKYMRLVGVSSVSSDRFAETLPFSLNDLISDSFYRELFMSPCLSGWCRGEDKHRYMHLCHTVLSRSQLNAVAKLKEAGIITRNLVVMPNTSNISLANNGIHLSLGSRKLTRLMTEKTPGLKPADEKYYGDLAIKIVEHFLSLFVGSYSAAPYRLDFTDFHPEKVLGFLPYELDFTHLRMIWRRWKKKANLKFFGRAVTPFGPEMVDRMLAGTLNLKGDFVQDFRLIDYLAAVLSTDQSSALNGESDSELSLKKDLAAMGTFDQRMPLYLLYRLRRFETMGFSGFEGRYYSLFHSLVTDMGEAANLQMLLTALAYKYIMLRQVTHEDIPDSPSMESERRQVFFGTAIGIPTFFVWKETRNSFLKYILKRTERIRPSRRYAGYLRVYNQEFRKALVRTIREDARDLIELMNLSDTLSDLEQRIDDPANHSAAGKITRGILDIAGERTPMKLTGHQFNAAAERYYRETLKQQHMHDGFTTLLQEIQDLDSWRSWREGYYNLALLSVFRGRSASDFVQSVRNEAEADMLSEEKLEKLIHLMLLVFHRKGVQCRNRPDD